MTHETFMCLLMGLDEFVLVFSDWSLIYVQSSDCKCLSFYREWTLFAALVCLEYLVLAIVIVGAIICVCPLPPDGF